MTGNTERIAGTTDRMLRAAYPLLQRPNVGTDDVSLARVELEDEPFEAGWSYALASRRFSREAARDRVELVARGILVLSWLDVTHEEPPRESLDRTFWRAYDGVSHVELE
jgi:hypothetical protein